MAIQWNENNGALPDTNETTGQEYFTAAEIATFLNVSEDEFSLMAGHADLVPVERDEQWLYPAVEVRRFLINAGVIEGDSRW